jgi:hypothetical protein
MSKPCVDVLSYALLMRSQNTFTAEELRCRICVSHSSARVANRLEISDGFILFFFVRFLILVRNTALGLRGGGGGRRLTQ